MEALKSQIKSLMDTVEKLAHEIGELKPRPVIITEEPHTGFE
jgi:FtsZ-binding cell division protein ZapB